MVRIEKLIYGLKTFHPTCTHDKIFAKGLEVMSLKVAIAKIDSTEME